jgi:hypothetical protein
MYCRHVQEFIVELSPFGLYRTVEHTLKIFSFCTAVSEMNPTSYPVSDKNQGTSSQKGDAGKLEKLNAQVRITYTIGSVI